MKNLIAISAVILLACCRCSDDDFSSIYADPSKNSEATCDKLMTGTFYNSITFTNPAHDGFNWGQRIGVFAQTFGTPNASPYSFDSYGATPESRWNSFYNSLITFRALENLYSKMSDADKAENSLFLWVAQIFIYHQLSEMLAVWGSVPYTEASTLLATGDIQASTPKYDSEADLYKLMLADLFTLSDNLQATSFSAAATGKLKAQDYINGGDILQWRKLANALILRLGIRLSSQGALVSEGKAAVTKILGNEASYPLPAGNADMVAYFSHGAGADALQFEDLGKGDESRILGWAAAAHLTRMVADGDPRLEVTYDAARDTAGAPLPWKGFDFKVPYAEGDNMTNTVKASYTRIDSAGFLQKNTKIPAVLFSAPEIWFLKAEAYQAGIVTGSAEEAFKKAVALSVEFYYNINAGSTIKDPLTPPAQSDIDAFAASRWTGYSSKEEAIATQKWLHLGFLQALEAWTELRRTGLPRLTYSTDQGANATSVSRAVPNRLRYPDNERLFNDANCPKVTDDKFETALLWAKSEWHDTAD